MGLFILPVLMVWYLFVVSYTENLFRLAAEIGVTQMVELFLRFNLHTLKRPIDYEDDPPLSLAAAGGHFGVVELLLKHGAKVNQEGFHCTRALHHAAGSGRC